MVITGLDHVQVAAPPGCEAEARGFYGRVARADRGSRSRRRSPPAAASGSPAGRSSCTSASRPTSRRRPRRTRRFAVDGARRARGRAADARRRRRCAGTTSPGRRALLRRGSLGQPAGVSRRGVDTRRGDVSPAHERLARRHRRSQRPDSRSGWRRSRSSRPATTSTITGPLVVLALTLGWCFIARRPLRLWRRPENRSGG